MSVLLFVRRFSSIVFSSSYVTPFVFFSFVFFSVPLHFYSIILETIDCALAKSLFLMMMPSGSSGFVLMMATFSP